jgi:uncharacterized protein YdaU (DUF1376 family)
MHYYTFHFKDYTAATAHLSNEEDLVYRRLIDLAFDAEGPVAGDANSIARRIRIADAMQVQCILSEFWVETPEGWVNNRVMRELERHKDHIEAKKNAAKIRWNKVKAKQIPAPDAGALQVQCTSNASGMLPNTQYPISISIKEAEEFSRGQGLPTDAIPEWHSHRSSQNWEKTSGVKITDWRSDLKAWIYRNARQAPRQNGNKPKSPEQSKYADHF